MNDLLQAGLTILGSGTVSAVVTARLNGRREDRAIARTKLEELVGILTRQMAHMNRVTAEAEKVLKDSSSLEALAELGKVSPLDWDKVDALIAIYHPSLLAARRAIFEASAECAKAMHAEMPDQVQLQFHHLYAAAIRNLRNEALALGGKINSPVWKFWS